MDFLLASDLHFDFHADRGRSFVASLPACEVIVVAGDLTNAPGLWGSLMLLLEKFSDVVFVLGNHDFFLGDFHTPRHTLSRLNHRLQKTDVRGRLHVLDNSTCEIQGQRFVGTTLWFPFFEDIIRHQHLQEDFFSIRGARKGIYREHKRSIEFLEETVQDGDIVVTHHLPSTQSLSPKRSASPRRHFYVSPLDDFILERKPAMWCHGHEHMSSDYVLGETRVLCNPYGYEGVGEDYLNPAFRKDFMVSAARTRNAAEEGPTPCPPTKTSLNSEDSSA